MKNNIINTGIFLLLSSFVLVSCSENKDGMDQKVQNSLSLDKKLSITEKDNVNVSVTVLASNIAFPRGLKFGPDGYLYVATAGFGGPNSTECIQVIPPIGPYKGGNTSKIIKISQSGAVSVVADHLPSSKNALGFTTGASDIEFIGNTLYALLVGGCSHGNSDYPSSVLKINQQNGTFSVVADLSSYSHSHPVAAPEIDDFEPDGDPYSMINVEGALYAIEPNHGEMVKITTSGTITRVIDFSAHYGHIVPTSVAYFDDDFYVGNLKTFPLVAGSSSIYKVSPDGEVEIWATGFTGILGVAFDKEHRLYVLETSAGGGPTPGTGRVVRVNNDNSRDVIVDKLFFPTGMTFGPDGALYISDTGFGPPTGKILKVAFND
jgi:hypothetical protein